MKNYLLLGSGLFNLLNSIRYANFRSGTNTSKLNKSLKSIISAFILMFLAVALPLRSQEISSIIEFNASMPDSPIHLFLEVNPRTDVHQIKISTVEPTKFASYVADRSDLTILPLSETSLLITCQSDGLSCFEGTMIPLARLLTDNSTYEQEFLIEYMNPNSQSLGSQTIRIPVPVGFPLPGPCSQSFMSFNTGVGLTQTQIDPHWTVIPSMPAYVVFNNRPTQSPNANWLNYQPYNWGGSFRTESFERKFCATSESTGLISLCVAADNSANVYFNNILIAQTTTGIYGFMYFSCINNVPVNIIAGTNVIRVYVRNEEADTGFIIANSSLTTANQVLGLASDKCCGDNVQGRVFGRKLWDLNCNGIADYGDSGLAGWTISLTDPSGGIQTATTDINGNYTFNNLLPGTYTLSESIQMGWTQSSSAGPYTVYVGPNGLQQRDFLNCKPPKCEELFREILPSDECCQTQFSISNANNSALQTLSYTVTGGVINSITTSACIATTIPVNLNGTTSGTLTFNTSCTAANTVIFYVNATSNTAHGEVCITWNADFVQGSQTYSCNTITCIHCERMPKSCNNKLVVTPNVYGPINTDYRTFTITNTKQPTSSISSVDIKFINESIPHHIGGGLIVDGINKSWTFANSGGPADAYTEIRMGCMGQSSTHGTAAVNSIVFNLGVDNTTIPLYSGIIQIKLGYCDGDTCELEYAWRPPIMNDNSGHLRMAEVPANPHIFAIDIDLPENAVSFSISLLEEESEIIAATAPQNGLSADETGLIGYNVFSELNTAFYEATTITQAGIVQAVSIMIVYTRAENSSNEQIPILIRFFDSEAKEIGYAEEIAEGIIITDIDDFSDSNNNFALEISPNPVNSKAKITLEMKLDEMISIVINDLQGREIIQVLDQILMPIGIYEFDVNSSELANGTYFVIAKTKDKQIISKQLIIVK